jgi:large subunit ribosomal protein L19
MNKQSVLQYVNQKFLIKKELPAFRVGDSVRVHVRITEGETTRVQIFEGIVISFTGISGTRNFTVRKISFGVGVERCFPLNSPAVEKIDVVRSGHVRRAKLYYLRNRIGKAARLEEKETLSSADTKKTAPAKPAAAAPAVKPELAVAKPK